MPRPLIHFLESRKLPETRLRHVIAAALCIWIASFHFSARADVAVTRLDEKGRFATIRLFGVISKSDVVLFERLVKNIRSGFETIEVDLNSTGGDVAAALAIGNLVRKEWLWTTVDDSSPQILCASACVYIFAAGAVRIAGAQSRIVIHRPYFDPQLFAKLQRNEARLKYDELSRQVQLFLARMGMSDDLFREMMRVPSNQGSILDFAKMEAMNLVGEDPGYMEWKRARSVVKFGESSVRNFEAWQKRGDAFIARCRTSEEITEFVRCGNLFESRDPNPLQRRSPKQ